MPARHLKVFGPSFGHFLSLKIDAKENLWPTLCLQNFRRLGDIFSFGAKEDKL
jgi:hypothetical protein